MPIKFNPATGRYENYTTDGGYSPIGPGGQMVPVPNTVPLNPNIGPAPTTTVPAPTYIPPTRGVSPSGRPSGPAGKPATPSTTVAPKTTTPKAVSPTTTAPKRSTGTPTTTVPKATTTTVPKATTTTVPKTSPTTTVPATTTTQRGGMGGPTAAQVKAGRYVGGKGFKQEDTSLMTDAIEAILSGNSDLSALTALLGASDGGGGGGAAATDYRNAYISGIRGAKQQEVAATQAQQMYNQLAQQLYGQQVADINARYAPQQTALDNYYATQTTTATDAINKAAADALANIKDPTAFANLQALVGTTPQQGLGADLAAYGASGQAAQQQAGTDEAYNKFLADLQNRSYQAQQAAGVDYATALRNAITGSQAAALTGLTQAITGLKAQDVANLRTAQTQDIGAAEDFRSSLMQAGLQALLQGQQNAATTRASTEQQFGAYKPKKSKGKGKGKGK